MPPRRRPKKIPFEFTTGTPKGEPSKQVSKLHHELRTLANEKFALEQRYERLVNEQGETVARLATAMEKAHAYITNMKAMPVNAFVALEQTAIGRVLDFGGVTSVTEILEWYRSVRAAGDELVVAAGKATR